MKPSSPRSADEVIDLVRKKRSVYWMREREARIVGLFHTTARTVPAYRDFLKKNRIEPARIRTLADLQLVPPTSKANYLRHYPFDMLLRKGELHRPLVFTSTSGSTGEPFYFPRSAELDFESSIIHELFLANGYRDGRSGPTLVIVGFGMGAWIGGLITYKAFELAAARRNLSVSLITPGVHREEILKALKNLAPHYSQVILAGYPPFVKDIIDEAVSRGIPLKKMNMRLLLAAESFTEKFRDYLARKTGMKNLIFDTMNVYGTADIGTMAYETPTSVLLRRLASGRKELFHGLFSDITKTPTLAQYNPLFTNFEAVKDEILITGNNSIPLIRYAIGDRGGVLSFDDVAARCVAFGVDLDGEFRAAGFLHGDRYELPFVYVYERVDFALKLHLRDIYPEIIKDVLLGSPFTSAMTGRFTMATKYNDAHDQYLEIVVELRSEKSVGKALVKLLHERILHALRVKTNGPGNADEFVQRRNLVKIIPRPYGDTAHFAPGGKQQWVLKH